MSEMSQPLISVIVPVYKTQEYLTRCVDSLLAQTYRNLEILLIDDGSPDESGAICDRFAKKDERVRVIHKENGGISDARNCGLDNFTGEYFVFVDSDDYVRADYVEYLYKLICDFDCKLAVCGYDVHFSDGNSIINKAVERYAVSAKECMERLFYDEFVTVGPWAKIYHRSLIGEIRYPFGKLFEDAGTTYRFIMKCDRIAFGEASKYFYAMRSQSIVTSDFNPHKIDLLEMSDAMCDAAEERWPELAKASLRRRVYVRFSTLNQMLDTDAFPEKKAEMIAFVRANRHAVLRDDRAPLRDKLALMMITFGYKFYRFGWKLYLKLYK